MIIKTDIDTIQNYATDASNYRGNPDKIVIPNNQKELIDFIKNNYNCGKHVNISGAGTGLTGGRVPDSGTVLSTENLKRIIEVNINEGYAIVEPGVTLAELEDELSKVDYFFAPNPTEKNSSIGGNVANNASGSRTFKYGSYRNHVLGLKVVLANGDELLLKREYNKLLNNELNIVTLQNDVYKLFIPYITDTQLKNASGYFLTEMTEPIDLFIGNEGTTGIISEIKLKILPKPQKILGLIVFFDDFDKQLKFIKQITITSLQNNLLDVSLNNDISARLIEYFDANSLNLLREEFPEIPKNTIGAIWIEQEHTEENEDEIISKWYNLIREYTNLYSQTWVAVTDWQHRKFADFRHQLPLAVLEKITRNRFRKVGTDTAVKFDIFEEYFRYIHKTFADSGLNYAIWGHIGNAHFHANFLPATPEEYELALSIYDSVLLKTIEMGGTVSAEHGLGKIKKKYLRMMYGDQGYEAMLNIKKILDPKMILSPGNLFD